MCLAIPGQVVSFEDETRQIVKVDVAGVRRRVHVGLLDPLQIGDWVLVHVGFAISRIDEQEAARTLRFLEELGAQFEQELEELRRSDEP
ncbi:MAG TPA: HypC/HybG/HupF family hydrogenase formation chaperone [Thermoanaerobaculia bacterium]|nr:HypC/HybG/HupF family hydrogenase formation chaperone [Thermoanaerobaculia bacterium]